MMKKTKKDGQPVRDERIQYSRGTHDEDHKILLNGKPVRTYRCANEENSARIILNGKPYSVYRRSENDRNVTFLNGIPYRGGEIPWVMKQEEWKSALEDAFNAISAENAKSSPPTVLVEEYIPGREFTVGVIDGEPLPVLEIVAPNGWYGYHEKYDSNETRYPFLEDGELAQKMQKIAVDAYKAVGCRGVTRVDFRVSPLGRCYVLELNTSPGFTSHSLVPKAGMKTGLTFAGVCDRILASAKHD